MKVKTEQPRKNGPNTKQQKLTGEVDHGLVCGDGPLLKKELVEVLAARRQNGFVCAVLLPLDQQGDVAELVAETLLVEFFQHGLAVFRQELIHLTFAVHLERANTQHTPQNAINKKKKKKDGNLGQETSQLCNYED